MDAIDLFNSDEAALPKTRPNQVQSFRTYLIAIFDVFLKKVAALNGKDYLSVEISNHQKSIKDFCDAIISSVNKYDQGFPHEAYTEVANAVQSHINDIEALLSIDDVSKTLQYIYRIRLGDGNPFKKGDLFHIPFQKRQLVTPRRYSIPGVPCLYFGGSLYVCWEELGRPDVNKIHMSLFRAAPKQDIKVLNFGYRPAVIASMINAHPNQVSQKSPMSDFAVAQAVCWPLIAACSIRVKFSESPFKPEYVVPQLVLQWLRTNRPYDGVRYFSTHIEPYINAMAASNFAFPVQTTNDTGYCTTLSDKFHLTEPLSWQFSTLAPTAASPTPNVHFDLEVTKGVSRPYVGSDFETKQSMLAQIDCTRI